ARESCRTGARERHAVVGAQPLWQTVAAKQPLEGRLRGRSARAGQRTAVEQIATAVIHDGQGITPSRIAGEKLPLEVSTPQRIGSLDAVGDPARAGRTPTQ